MVHHPQSRRSASGYAPLGGWMPAHASANASRGFDALVMERPMTTCVAPLSAGAITHGLELADNTFSTRSGLTLPLFSALHRLPIMRTSLVAAGQQSSVAQTSSGRRSPASSAISYSCKTSTSRSPRPWRRAGWQTFCRTACQPSVGPTGSPWEH